MRVSSLEPALTNRTSDTVNSGVLISTRVGFHEIQRDLPSRAIDPEPCGIGGIAALTADVVVVDHRCVVVLFSITPTCHCHLENTPLGRPPVTKIVN
ncbi:MAG: hypothetical protein HC933_15675 [Pleurocapsa sp. SU_196_0]|nr:hypothetical protein [Pleurocapsa sp. SU_196_0]